MTQHSFAKYQSSDKTKNKQNNNFFGYFYHAPGSVPGTLRISQNALPPRISLTDYDAINFLKLDDIRPEDCIEHLDNESVSWVDVGGLGDLDVFLKLGDIFKIPPLILEDVFNVPQRPKIEEYDHQLLIITQMVVLRPNNKGFWLEQVSFILSKHHLLTIQEEADQDCFDRIRDRLQQNKGIIRKQGADFLAYALWDAVIDGFFPVLENLGDRIEELEDEVVIAPTPDTLAEIHKIKRELLALRRAIWPQRDALSILIRDGNSVISDDVLRYLRDCYDHTVMIIDMVETYRELASGLMDVYLSAVSNKMNEVMQLLTVISSIFIPLTFIAGIYGMNFDTNASNWNMPELNWHFGYLFCLGIMGVIALVLLIFFWRKGWLKIGHLR